MKVDNITLYDVKELAKLLNLTPEAVRIYMRTRLKGVKIGTKWYCSKKNLAKFLNDEEQK